MMRFECNRCGKSEDRMYSLNNVYDVEYGVQEPFFEGVHLCESCLKELKEWLGR